MARLTAPLELPLPDHPVEAALALLQQHGRTHPARVGTIRVRAASAQRIHARRASSRTQPACFLGRLEAAAPGSVLTGRVLEARGNRIADLLFRWLAVLMLSVAVLCGVNRVWVGLGVCGGSALAFAAIAAGSAGLRRPAFRADAAELRRFLAGVLRSPEPLPDPAAQSSPAEQEAARELQRGSLQLLQALERTAPRDEVDRLTHLLVSAWRRLGLHDREAAEEVAELERQYLAAPAAERAALRAGLEAASEEPLG